MTIGYPTFRDVRDLAHKLWEEKGSPTASQVPPEHIWHEAEKKLTPIIILAISHELQKSGILRKPGDSFYSDHYYRAEETATWGNPPRISPFAYGNLHENGEYTIRHRRAARPTTFDLNREYGLTGLIEYLKQTANAPPEAEINLQPPIEISCMEYFNESRRRDSDSIPG